MVNKVKREPVLVAAAVVALLNLLVGADAGITQESVESLVVLVTGLLVRRQVSPVAAADHPRNGADCC